MSSGPINANSTVPAFAPSTPKMKILVTSPELVDTILLSSEGIKNVAKKPVTKVAKSEGSAMKPKAKKGEKQKGAGELAASIDALSINSSSGIGHSKGTLWNEDNDGDEINAVHDKLGLKPSGFRPMFAYSSDEDGYSGSELSVDGDDVASTELLQTWDNESNFSQTEDNDF